MTARKQTPEPKSKGLLQQHLDFLTDMRRRYAFILMQDKKHYRAILSLERKVKKYISKTRKRGP